MKIILFFLALFLANLLFAQQKLSVDSFFNINLSSHERDSLNKQIAYYTNKIKNDSSNQAMFFMRAQTYVLLGMHHKAVKVYNMLLKLDSLNPVFYYIRALCKSKHGFILDACKDLFKASALGLEQAKDVYNKRCPLYFNEIEKK
ncbi:MAG: hypothetical protein ACUVQP_03520 [Bacteroidales bacterium]